MIGRADIDALKAAMPEVLKYYGVRDLSRNFSSPWRRDKDPSCHFYPDTNLVTDFGEGVTVDVFGLVSKMERGHGFADQVRTVARIARYSLDESPGYRPSGRSAGRPRFAVPDRAGFDAEPLLNYLDYMSRLLEGGPGMDYLQSRGLYYGEAFRHVLGFVDSPEAFGGLFSCYEPNAPRGYVVVPFPTDETFAQVDYVMLRAVPGEKPPEHKEIRPKGVTSPLFHEYLLTEGLPVLYVVEGLIDAISLESMLGRPVLALGGTSLSKRVGRVLYHAPRELRPRKVILALDADDAGERAAGDIEGDLDVIGVPHGRLEMPEGCKDPNDMLLKVEESIAR